MLSSSLLVAPRFASMSFARCSTTSVGSTVVKWLVEAPFVEGLRGDETKVSIVVGVCSLQLPAHNM